jgi:NAD(P)-dependent dehydrogenase (short-subunit alcohol dehydrogenase family)
MSTPSETAQRLAGQVAIVTGAGRGIGRSIAIALAAEGAAVAAVARTNAEIAETADLIARSAGRAMAFCADVTDVRAVSKSFAEIERELGPATLLVNNAGALKPLGPFVDCDPEEWWRTMEANVRGPALCSYAVLPGMIARRKGRIVTVASGAGTNAILPYFSAYVTSKTAAVRFAEALALEAKEHGISVFAIGPGTVRTSMTEITLESPEGKKWLPWFRSIFDEGRNVAPERAAGLVATLAAGKADALTGRFISINDDLNALLMDAPRIERENLYTLRLKA